MADFQLDKIPYAEGIKIENLEANEESDQLCRVILERLRFNQVVRVVHLDYSQTFGSIESCEILGELVKSSGTLSDLSLHGCGLTGEGLEYVITGLLSNPNSALRRLAIGSNFKLGRKGAELVEQLLLRNMPTFHDLDIWGAGFTREDTTPVARALAKNTTLRRLVCGVGYGITHLDREGPLSRILMALTPIDKLTPEQATYQDDTYNQTLQDLSINYDYEKGIAENLIQMITNNSSLRSLGLRNFQFTREQWREVWDALKHNNLLNTMDLYRCGQGLGDAFNDLMELLQANRTLRKIQLGETPLETTGQSAIVQQQLDRNERLANYLGTLNNRLNFVPPKIGRLFLCGYPKAGKTTLRRSMVATQRNIISRILFSAIAYMARVCWVVASNYDKRTEGIEIRLLIDSEDKHIAVWDMAGQDEYHALHDSHYMFPDINQACKFLILYRPAFDENSGTWLEEDSINSLERQLWYWLGFINSNSRKTGWVLPHVSVVLTHLDKLSVRFGMDETRRAQRYIQWASAKIDVLRQCFKGRVDLSIKVHSADTFSIPHARGVVDDVLVCFDQLFSNTLPEVPAACEEMNLFLSKWTASHNSCPIITQEKFFNLCKQNVRELDALFQEVPPELANEATDIREGYRKKNQLAVASYLHDVGSIVHFSKSNFVVVDPNWLGKVFLGQLFRPGDVTYEPIILNTKNGCVSHENLQAALEDYIQSRKYRGFTTGDLIELMKELELCYEENSGTDPPTRSYFIPSTLSDPDLLAREGRRKLEWMVQGKGLNPTYSGLRLQCTDQSRTFLSPGFFQRFQVYLQTFLRQENLTYEIEKNLIRLKHDGIELLVEKSGDHSLFAGDYVDILEKSYSSASKERHYLYGKVVEQLRSFCASREGCPGVALQEAILRPGCVEKLTLCCHRKDQAVVKETLKATVIQRLFESDKLHIWDDGGYANSVTEMSQIYKHLFPAVPDDKDLPEEWIEAMSLLNLTDVKEAIFKYRTVISEKRYAIFQAVDELERVTETKVPSQMIDQGESKSPERDVDESHGPPDGPDWWAGYQNQMEKYIQEMEMRIRDPLQRQLRDAEANIISKIQEQRLLLEHIKLSMEDMQMLHQTLHSTLVDKLDAVMGFTADYSVIPTMPYFSDQNVGWKQRLVAFFEMGTPLTLQFMCESPSQPHYVENQPGFPFTNTIITGDFMNRLKPILSASLKVLFLLIKAGLHITAGIGDVIGDFASAPAAAPLVLTGLTGEAIIENIKLTSGDEMDNTLEDAWEFIQTVIAQTRANGEFHTRFKLHLVQYKSEMLSKYLAKDESKRKCFWLCSKCRNEADQANLLRQW